MKEGNPTFKKKKTKKKDQQMKSGTHLSREISLASCSVKIQ